MATQLNLNALNSDSPYIVKIRKALVKAVQQEIPIVDVSAPKRLEGDSLVKVDFVFTGNQKLSLYVRSVGDVTRFELNGKRIIVAGDFSNDHQQTFDNATDSVARYIRNNQKKFEEQQTKQRIEAPKQPKPKTDPNNKPKGTVSQQLTQIKLHDEELKQQIEQKKTNIEELKQQLGSL